MSLGLKFSLILKYVLEFTPYSGFDHFENFSNNLSKQLPTKRKLNQGPNGFHLNYLLN